MRIDWLSTSPTKAYLTMAITTHNRKINFQDWLSCHPLPPITIYKWGTWGFPINLETAIQRCFIKMQQLFQNSTPLQVPSREFSEMLRTTICKIPEIASTWCLFWILEYSNNSFRLFISITVNLTIALRCIPWV